MHFTLKEFTHSNTAEHLGIKNEFSDPKILENISNLCVQVLEPLRAHFKTKVLISSGYRCPQLNEAIGGATHSLHLQGRAADIIPPVKDDNGRPIAQEERSTLLQNWYQYIKDHLPHTELIHEGTWIHVALSLCLILLLSSCSTSRNFNTGVYPEHSRRDTVLIHQMQYDSIYIDHTHTQEYHPSSLTPHNPSLITHHPVDTLILHDKEVHYKYKLLHDTIRIHQTDSIPILQQIYIPQKPSRLCHIYNTLYRLFFYILLFLLIYLLIKLIRHLRLTP